MVHKSLEQLKRERNRLLRGSKARASLDSLSKARNLERKKISAEISALKRPGSLAAKKSLKSAAGKFGKFIKKRADIVTENLDRMAREDEREEKQSQMRRKSPNKRKIKRRRK